MGETRTFHDFYHATIEELPDSLVHVEIEVDPEGTVPLYKKAAKEVAKKVTIPGYRRGKAPVDLLKKHYAPRLQEAFEMECAQGCYMHVIKDLPRISVSQPKVTKISCTTPQEKAVVRFEYQAHPTPHPIDWSDFSIEDLDKNFTPTQEEIDRQVRRHLMFLSEFHKVDRCAQEGDFLMLGLDKVVEGNREPIHESLRIKLDSQDTSVPPGVMEQLLGKGVDDSFEIELSEDFFLPKEKVLLPQGTYAWTICSIEALDLHPIDEKVFEKYKVSSEQEFLEKMEALVVKDKKELFKQACCTKLEEYLREKYPTQVPSEFLDSLAHIAWELQIAHAHFKGFDSDWITKEKDRYKASTRQACQQRLETLYILTETSEQLKIQPTNFEIRMKEFELRFTFGIDIAQLDEATARKIYQHLAQEIIIDKTLEKLIEDRYPEIFTQPTQEKAQVEAQEA